MFRGRVFFPPVFFSFVLLSFALSVSVRFLGVFGWLSAHSAAIMKAIISGENLLICSRSDMFLFYQHVISFYLAVFVVAFVATAIVVVIVVVFVNVVVFASAAVVVVEIVAVYLSFDSRTKVKFMPTRERKRQGGNQEKDR